MTFSPTKTALAFFVVVVLGGATFLLWNTTRSSEEDTLPLTSTQVVQDQQPSKVTGLPPETIDPLASLSAMPKNTTATSAATIQLTGLMTRYPTKRPAQKTTDHRYAYLVSTTGASKDQEFTLDLFALMYEQDQLQRVDALAGHRVKLSGTISQTFLDPRYPGQLQKVVQVETIESAE